MNATPTAGAGRNNGARLTLVCLVAVHVCNQLDRNILGILAHPIKQDLHLSDSTLGLIAGPAFAVLYASLGIPAAAIADRTSRRTFIALSCALWSVITALTGFVQSGWQLALARVGLAIGEAGSGPASVSMIGDLYPPDRRSGAMAWYSTGKNFGVTIGFMLGGSVAAWLGWRTVFFVIGGLGIGLTLLTMLWVREPARSSVELNLGHSGNPLTVLTHFMRLPAAMLLLGAATIEAAISYSMTSWLPSFLIRSHHLDVLTVGLVVGPITGVVGLIGAVFGGSAADRLERWDSRWNARLLAVMSAIAVPAGLAIFLAPSFATSMVAYAVFVAVHSVFLGCTYAMIQVLSPANQRAMGAAILLFCMNSVGLGLGPWLTGVASDLLAHVHGTESLRYSLGGTVTLSAVSAVLFWMAGHHYRRFRDAETL